MKVLTHGGQCVKEEVNGEDISVKLHSGVVKTFKSGELEDDSDQG
jgi:hypothetical protein